MRIGQGFDIHRLEEGRPLILGGIKIPSPKGVVGHSDGDALFHAVTDALLGAVSKGDIGQLFPDTDPKNKNQNSELFLKRALQFVQEAGFKIANVDTTVILQAPKLAEFIPPMRRKLAVLLGLQESQVSIKAKTHEKLDSLGRQEGVAVHAVVLLM
ncbi:MAG: 2-C-methyl-D-erythritol 2,4-cyclodiphosphate synthase [Deltaproteobacteria bacterium]|nr:2-C-methyl-D-erythritol 2,4-cyclodiphosphate synthase [Deltaproteobacteria bacterium]MBI4223573.1 2-C-methyl-D-erythritol 2,4-cyclodiphosphate synthase [Deltaproteobacteria bacterium]